MTRGLAGISGFLEKAKAHADQTKGDKYAQDRQHEPADVLTEWFPNDPFLWNAGKYLSRLPRTKKESDFFKAIHYIGMSYNKQFGHAIETEKAVQPQAVDPTVFCVTDSNGRLWQFPVATAETPSFLTCLMTCLKIFDDRQRKRGPWNINKIGAMGCLDHVIEKAERAKEALRQLYALEALSERGTAYELKHAEILKDLADSMNDGANFNLIGLMKAQGIWPPNPDTKTVQDTGVPP